SCSRRLAPIDRSLKIEKSSRRCAGPCINDRPTLPDVKLSAAEKTLVSNQRCTVRSLEGRFGLPLTFGRSPPFNVPALLPVLVRDVALTTVYATPDCRYPVRLTCQSARKPCATPVNSLPHG